MSLKNIATSMVALLGVSLTACGDETNTSRRTQEPAQMPATAQKAAQPKTVFISDIEAIFLKIEGEIATGVSVEEDGVEIYKVCKESQPGYADTVMFLYNKDKRQLEYDKQQEAKARASGKAFKNTWSAVRSATLLDACPSGAAARCEVSNVLSWYYNTSPRVLSEFKKACGYLAENIWTTNP